MNRQKRQEQNLKTATKATPVYRRVTLRAPATTANVGPGFDSLGCALTLYNTYTVTRTESGLAFDGCLERHCNPRNLFYVAYCAALDKMGVPPEERGGLHIAMQTDIPISRGLGSSAALIAGGAAAANLMYGSPLSREQLLRIGTALEHHPDNVAPAIYGGFTASLLEDGVPYTVGCPVAEGLRFCALIPDFETSTAAARAALPKSYSRSDAVYNLSHTALLLRALESGNDRLLRRALRDRLHQPYRCRLIDGYAQVKEASRHAGGIAFFISGSGSTCMSLYRDERFVAKMREALAPLPHHWQVVPLEIDPNGVCLVAAE